MEPKEHTPDPQLDQALDAIVADLATLQCKIGTLHIFSSHTPTVEYRTHSENKHWHWHPLSQLQESLAPEQKPQLLLLPYRQEQAYHSLILSNLTELEQSLPHFVGTRIYLMTPQEENMRSALADWGYHPSALNPYLFLCNEITHILDQEKKRLSPSTAQAKIEALIHFPLTIPQCLETALCAESYQYIAGIGQYLEKAYRSDRKQHFALNRYLEFLIKIEAQELITHILSSASPLIEEKLAQAAEAYRPPQRPDASSSPHKTLFISDSCYPQVSPDATIACHHLIEQMLPQHPHFRILCPDIPAWSTLPTQYHLCVEDKVYRSLPPPPQDIGPDHPCASTAWLPLIQEQIQQFSPDRIVICLQWMHSQSLMQWAQEQELPVLFLAPADSLPASLKPHITCLPQKPYLSSRSKLAFNPDYSIPRILAYGSQYNSVALSHLFNVLIQLKAKHCPFTCTILEDDSQDNIRETIEKFELDAWVDFAAKQPPTETEFASHNLFFDLGSPRQTSLAAMQNGLHALSRYAMPSLPSCHPQSPDITENRRLIQQLFAQPSQLQEQAEHSQSQLHDSFISTLNSHILQPKGLPTPAIA